MNDNIAHIDQYPIALGHAFDPARAKARILDPFDQMLGNSPHLARGSAGRDHHIVGNRGFTAKVDGDNIFGLVLVETV